VCYLAIILTSLIFAGPGLDVIYKQRLHSFPIHAIATMIVIVIDG